MDIKKEIIPAMILAPSAHNSQPWHFRVGRQTVDVFVVWDRHLGIGDPTQRQLYQSLGCAIENGVIAGEAQGMTVSVAYFPEGRGKKNPAARIVFTPGSSPNGHTKALADAIPRRRTDRSIYNGKPLTADEKALLTIARQEGVVLVEERDTIDALAQLASEGTTKTLARSDFKGELATWVRSSLTRQHDGMTGDSMGMPAPLALVAPYIVPIAPIHKMEGPNALKQMKSASAVAVFTAAEDTPEAFMTCGRLLNRLWLEVTAAGLAAAVHASPIESSDDLRQRTQQALHVTALPQTTLRIGHSKKKHLKPTPRRTVEEVLVS